MYWLLALFVALSTALSCTEQWECNVPNTTEAYSFVACINETCTCRLPQGFIGSGEGDPCRCNETVFWVNGIPYCQNLDRLAKLEQTQDLDLALTCEQTWQCSPTATDLWQAVNCSEEGRCRCNFELGFSGGGNQTDPCRCAAPRIIVWNDCVAFCVDVTGLVVLQPTPVPVPVAPPVEPAPVPVSEPVVAPVPIVQPQGPILRPVTIIVTPPVRRPLQRVPLAVQQPVEIQAPSNVVVVLPSPDGNNGGTVLLPTPSGNNGAPQTVVIGGNNNPGASGVISVTPGGDVNVGGQAGTARTGVDVNNGNVNVVGAAGPSAQAGVSVGNGVNIGANT